MRKRSIIFIVIGIVLVALIVLGAAIGGALAQRFSRSSVALAFSPRLAQPEQEKGLLVASVVLDSPAAEAGLKRGDIVLTVDGKEVNNIIDLKEIIEEKQPGDKVELAILHGDDQRSLTVTLGKQDELPFLGVVSCDSGIAGPNFVYRFHPGKGIPPGLAKGAMVVEVTPDSPADKAGLKEGDRILSVGGEKVSPDKNLAELIGDHKPGDTIVLEVIRKDEEETQEITVTLGEHPQDKGKAYLGIQYAPVAEITIEGERPPLPIPFPPFARPGVEGGEFELPEGVTSGVWVGKVIEGSPADQAGLLKGDLITAIDGKSVQDLNPKDFTKTIQKHKPGNKVTLTVYRENNEEALEIQVTLGEDPEQTGNAYLGIEALGFVKVDKSGNPKRDFHFEFKLPDWFDSKETPYPPPSWEIHESGNET